jgi:hypothetical protein
MGEVLYLVVGVLYLSPAAHLARLRWGAVSCGGGAVPFSGGAVPCGDALRLAVGCDTVRWGAVPFSSGVFPHGEVIYLVVTVRYLVV